MVLKSGGVLIFTDDTSMLKTVHNGFVGRAHGFLFLGLICWFGDRIYSSLLTAPSTQSFPTKFQLLVRHLLS